MSEFKSSTGDAAFAASQYTREKEYWVNKLDGELVRSTLPRVYGEEINEGVKENYSFRFPVEVRERLLKMSNKSPHALFIILAAGVTLLLDRYTDNRDIIIGAPIYKQAVEGQFVNTVLPLRSRIDGAMSFKQLLMQMKGTVTEANSHQNYPIETLLYKLDMTYDGDDFPLFDTAVLLENIHKREYLEPVKPGLVFSFNMNEDDIAAQVEYHSRYYAESTVSNAATHFMSLLKDVLFNVDRALSETEILTEEEKKKITREFNDSSRDYAGDRTIHQLFEEQAKRTPENIAVSGIMYSSGRQEQDVTYGQLNLMADNLAILLKEKGVGEDVVVGIMTERSVEMIAAMLAVLKAGGAYLPIDPTYPPERIRYLLDDSAAPILLTSRSMEEVFGKEIIYLEDAFQNDASAKSADTLKETSGNSSHLAYIIYTSGSTGRPKGVAVEHYSAVNTLTWRRRFYGFNREDAVLQLPSFAFDSSVEDIFTPLISGARLVLVEQDSLFNLPYLAGKLKQYNVTHFLIVPAFYKTFLQEIAPQLQDVRSVTVAGDNFTPRLVREHFEKVPHIKLYNEYGPTENSVCTTVYPFPQPGSEESTPDVLIGKPIDNVSCYIVNRHGKLNPIGAAGELWVSGTGLARGYLNDPQLTHEKFTTLPESPAVKIYKTGDRASWQPDGNIRFAGRVDTQVKIRGFRIEPGEIESRLTADDAVKEAVVTAGAKDDGSKYLCAYIVPIDSIENAASAMQEIKNRLAAQVPDYMVPAYFVPMEKFPLTPNGKSDRKALPKPGTAALEEEYIPPSGEVEEKLVQIWAQLLEIEEEKVGVASNFFTLGGHSLKATVLIAKIHKIFDVRIQLAEIFQNPVIRSIAEYINNAVKEKYTSLQPAGQQEYYALSSAQQRLYILQQMETGNTGYNVPLALKLRGPLDLGKLENTFKMLIDRHESLRTSFHTRDKEAVQKIHADVPFAIERLEARGGEHPAAYFIRPFDLATAPLIRVGVLQLEQDVHVLMVDMHHIVTDAVSMEILVREFGALYAGRNLPPITLQYKDFAEWRNCENEQEAVKSQGEFWLKEFAGEIPTLDLPLDFSRPQVLSFEGRSVAFRLEPEQTRKLKALAGEEDATMFMLLLAAFNILVSRLCGREDIVIGTPVAGRRHADLQGIIGMFVNTLALRNFPVAEISFVQFLRSVKTRTLGAFENQDYPFEELVDRVVTDRDTGRNPLFDIMFAFNEAHATPPEEQDMKEGLETEPFPFEGNISKFDLSLDVTAGESLDCGFQYSTLLFQEETVQRFIVYFKNILHQIIQAPDLPLWQIDFIAEEEKERLLHTFNRPSAGFPDGDDYPAHMTIHEIFARQVEKTPEETAVEEGDRVLTYRELDMQSDILAQMLRKEGVVSGSIVAVALERSAAVPVSLLAILKAGGAYLPIDERYPADRIDYMLADSGAGLMLASRAFGQAQGPAPTTKKIIYVDELLSSGSLDNDGTGTVSGIISASDLAYIIYTSGSTGRPKGVMVEHRNVVRLVKNTNYIRFAPGDRILPTGSLAFDISTFEIWGPLLNGAAMCLVSNDTVLDLRRLEEVIIDKRINILHLIPQLFEQHASQRMELFSTLKCFLIGGDLVRPGYINLLRNRYRELEILHIYGPTENTTFSTWFSVDKPYEMRIPLGYPIRRSTVYIVDKYNRPVPIGVEGELLVGGEGLGRGYLNNPQLTAESFIPFPPSLHSNAGRSSLSSSSLLYKTGDRARWLADGKIEFLGRIDAQVKIRGFRIQPEEIENRLLEHPAVLDAAVLPRDGSSAGSDKFLCAWFVPRHEPDREEIGVKELREFLAGMLPDYMVPTYFTSLEKMPLNPNGKIDRKALPMPEALSGVSHVPISGQTEEKLAALWAEILEIPVENIGAEDDFFHLGGHSLKATFLAAAVNREFNISIPLSEIFKMRRLRALAGHIGGPAGGEFRDILPVEKRDYYPMSPAQKRLYTLQQMDPGSTVYNMPLKMEIAGSLEVSKLEDVFRSLIRRHESLRTSFRAVNGTPCQIVHDTVDFAIERNVEMDTRPFDLSAAPLLRVGVMEKGENRYTLMVDIHHIISDAVTTAIVRTEFSALYDGTSLPPLKLQYKDFSQWQQDLVESGAMQRQEEFWLQRFSGQLPELDMPLDFPRPPVRSSEGDESVVMIDHQLTAAVRDLARSTGTTLYQFLMSVYIILLYKYTGQTDIIVGSPVSGRVHADLRDIVGVFVNMVALRSRPEPGMTFAQFLEQVKTGTIAGYDNQDYQFDRLVNKLGLQGTPGRNPIFDVAFLYNAPQSGGRKESSLEITPSETQHRVSRFDMLLAASEGEQDIQLAVEYCSKLFTSRYMERFLEQYVRLLRNVAAEGGLDRALSQLDILAPEEREEYISRFNDTVVPYPSNQPLHRLFEEQVEKTPDNTALAVAEPGTGTTTAGKPSVMTYRELNSRANSLAHTLLEKGVGRGGIVGIIALRSIDTIVGMLAVLKTGAAYLPISPRLPLERRRFMLSDAGVSVLLVPGEAAGELEDAGNQMHDALLSLNLDDAANYGSNTENPQVPVSPGDAGYIIYTSGTTGKPKGVMLERRGIVNYLTWAAAMYVKGEALDFPLYTDLSFDLTVTSLFTPLITGNTVHIYSGDDREPLIENILRDNKCGVMKLTPAHLKLMSELMKQGNIGTGPGNRLKRFILGGENLETSLAREIHELSGGGIEIYNEYGPTETVVGSMIHRYTTGDDDRSSVPIGVPVANTQIYLLDRDFNPVPVGVPGQLYIGGAGVGRGYLNRPGLTAEKFISLPSSSSSSRLYKTGDMAKRLPDGRIEFLGRIDQQVKIRGFRIELGEIESRLKQFKKHKHTVSILEEAPVDPDQLKKVHRCTRCLLSANYPGIRFDSEGVCNECRDYETYEAHVNNYFSTPDRLEEMLRDNIRPGAKYDCLLLFSGGKDSTYVLYRLIDMGLKVLTFTFDNGYISEAAFENIRRTTAALNVDHIAGRKETINRAFVHSLETDAGVCHGCWNALNACGAQVAHEHGIDLVVSGLSRGQIFDMRLHGLYKAGIFEPAEIEEKLNLFRKNFHSEENKFARVLEMSLAEEVLDKTGFVDFFRYDATRVNEIRQYLFSRGWVQPQDTGFCSSNCLINDVGIYMHIKERGYHFYEGPLSWDVRMGQMTRESGIEEIGFQPDAVHVDRVLGEIGYYEAPGITDAVVLDRLDEKGNRSLCAYIVSGIDLTVVELRRYLEHHLPDYMVPAQFVQVDTIPVTPGGKVDRRALAGGAGEALKSGVKYVAPADEKEILVTGICKEIFSVDRVGMDDNFFQLGATSFEIIQVSNKLAEALGIEVPVLKLFEHPTAAQLLEYLQGAGGISVEKEKKVEEEWDKAVKKGKSRFEQRRKKRR